MKSIYPVFVFLCALCLTASASELHDPRTFSPPPQPDWQYAGPTGPGAWRMLPGDQLCGDGLNQSPIAIEPGWKGVFSNVARERRPVPIVPRWTGAPLQIVNNGRTVQVLHDPGSTLEVDGVRYMLTQFHFHSPSEHIVDETQHPLEAHFVHTSTDPKHPGTAVVAVFFEAGYYENPELAKIWSHVPAHADAAKVVNVPGVSTDPSGFLPRHLDYLRYEGSLTTPPCTQGVQWILFTHPISASLAQLRAIQKWEGGPTNRPVQPVNGRLIRADYF